MRITSKTYLILDNIRQLKEIGSSDGEIMKELHLSYSDYRVYFDMICRLDRLELQRQQRNVMPHEIVMLRWRYLRTFKNLHEIATSDKTDARSRLEAERLKIEAATKLVQLLADGKETLINAEREIVRSRSGTGSSIPKGRPRTVAAGEAEAEAEKRSSTESSGY